MWVPHRDLARRRKSSEARNSTNFEVLHLLDWVNSLMKRRTTWHYLPVRWVPADSISQPWDLALGRSEAVGGPLDGDHKTIPILSPPCATLSTWASTGSKRRRFTG